MKKVKWHIYIPIIISILSLLVAWRAYETCKLQTELTKNSFLPNIQVKENLESRLKKWLYQNLKEV